MKKRPRKSAQKRRRSTVVRGTVEYLNFRTARIRTDDGERYTLPAEHSPVLMPGDRVSDRIVKSQGRAKFNPFTVNIEPCEDFQVVLQIDRRMVGGRNVESYTVIGFNVSGIIECPADMPECENGKCMIATLSRQRLRTPEGMVWKVISIDRMLNGSMEVACAVALTRFGIRDHFSPALVKELDSVSDSFDLDGRRDLRDLPFVTIDPASAKDHDDAVLCERSESGEFHLRVAIADVSHYVQPSTELDSVAQQRGASIYLPGWTVSMLPSELSNNLCSLKSEEDRLALVCDMFVSARGQVTAYEFYEAVIRSHAALSYEDVDAVNQTGRWSKEVVNNINHQFEVYKAFVLARESRGALSLELPEAKLKFDANGAVESVSKSVRLLSYGLIEEAMLAANTCAAKFLAKHYPAAAMYRIHENPTLEDLHEINSLLNYFGLDYEFSPESTVADYQHVVNILNKHHAGVSTALQLHLLRSLSTAVYSPESRPHFALNYPQYTHFTSPIRRYPDLVVHRLIKQVLRGKKHSPEIAELTRVAQLSSHRERRADRCAREAEQWLKAEFMKAYIGEEFKGIIVDTRKFGIFVQLDSPYIDGMVPVYELGDEYFHYNDLARILVGSVSDRVFEIGQNLHIKVQSADPPLGHVNFELAYSRNRRRPKRG